MPTGYTQNMDISFNDFALTCARAFGATITLRDEPISSDIPEFQPSDWNTKELAKAQSRLIELTEMTSTDKVIAASDYNASKYENFLNVEAADMDLRDKYETMLQKVELWQPPTPDHTELKEFMVNQLKESIEWDCNYKRETPVPLSAEEWYFQELEEAARNIKSHSEEYIKEVKRVNKRNAWVSALKESLYD